MLSGAPRTRNRYPTPSGMLLKAVLIAGATDVLGMIRFQASSQLISSWKDDDLSHCMYPKYIPAGYTSLLGVPLAFSETLRSRFTGFGRLDLSRSLPLLGNLFDPGFNLQVVDMVPIQEGEVHTYGLVSSGGPLSVTLVWFDYPAEVISEVALVNDLDLVVTVSSNATTAKEAGNWRYLGNGPASGGGDRDRRNTVERVALHNVAQLSAIEIAVRLRINHMHASKHQLPMKRALNTLNIVFVCSPWAGEWDEHREYCFRPQHAAAVRSCRCRCHPRDACRTLQPGLEGPLAAPLVPLAAKSPTATHPISPNQPPSATAYPPKKP